MGWLAYRRMDRFIVLRDRYGYVQVGFFLEQVIFLIAGAV